MIVALVNTSSVRMPKKFIEAWLHIVEKELVSKKVQGHRKLKSSELTVVFLNTADARALNKKYRKKNYATDVLSFSTDAFGELVLCPQVIRRQAKEHDLSFQQELAYMLLHGVLHLLGYDHEQDPREAERMFSLQDQIFDKHFRK